MSIWGHVVGIITIGIIHKLFLLSNVKYLLAPVPSKIPKVLFRSLLGTGPSEEIFYTVPVVGNIAVVEVAIDTVAVVVAVMFAAWVVLIAQHLLCGELNASDAPLSLTISQFQSKNDIFPNSNLRPPIF